MTTWGAAGLAEFERRYGTNTEAAANSRSRWSASRLHDLGPVTTEVGPELERLVRHYAGTDPDEAAITAAVERVKREVPEPFEPMPSRTAGARGLIEFRRRFPDEAGKVPAPNLVALDERLARDRRKVDEALTKAGIVA